MNIIKEDLNGLNAVLKLKIEESDYHQKVDTILKDYRKKMNMPGFRPGMVPMSVVHKMYGVAVKAEEINKILNDHIYKYLEDQKIEFLGNPIPADDKLGKADFETQKEFIFSYELGLSPKFSINLSDKYKLNKYVIRIDDALVQKNIKDLRRRHGKVSEATVSEENDMLVGIFTELKKENPLQRQSSIYLEFVEDEAEKKKVIGLKVGDKVTVDPRKLVKEDHDLAVMLGVKEEDLKKYASNFELEIKSIHRVELAEENQDFYDRIFGPGKVNGHDEFIQKTTEELIDIMADFSNKKLKKDVFDYLMDKLKLELPDAFLKKWLKMSNQALNDEKISEDYEKFSKDMKWMLIENKLVKENNMELRHEEMLDYVKELLKKQYQYYSVPVPEDTVLTEHVNSVLSNEKEAQKLSSELMEKKMYKLFNEKISLKEKELSYDEFLKVLKEKPKVNLFSKIFNL